MLHYRRCGFAFPESQAFTDLLREVLRILDDAKVHLPPLHFLFDAGPNNRAGVRMAERFPELAAFGRKNIDPAGPPNYGPFSNLDGRWQGCTGIEAEATRQFVLHLVSGIPSEFPMWITLVLLGPLRWGAADGTDLEPREASMRLAPINKAPFSGLSPSMTYLVPGIILQRVSMYGLRMWTTEQLPEADAPYAADSLQTLLKRFGPPETNSVHSVPESQEVRVGQAASAEAAKVHAEFKNQMKDIVETLALPYRVPEPREFGQLPREPLGKIRATIVATFKGDGWRAAAEKLPAGTHKLWKQTPGGRRMELAFDTGSWSRHVVCAMALFSERGAARIPIPADSGLRLQYLTPNPHVFGGVLGNMRRVVLELERTWMAAMEAAIAEAQ